MTYQQKFLLELMWVWQRQQLFRNPGFMGAKIYRITSSGETIFLLCLMVIHDPDLSEKLHSSLTTVQTLLKEYGKSNNNKHEKTEPEGTYLYFSILPDIDVTLHNVVALTTMSGNLLHSKY